MSIKNYHHRIIRSPGFSYTERNRSVNAFQEYRIKSLLIKKIKEMSIPDMMDFSSFLRFNALYLNLTADLFKRFGHLKNSQMVHDEMKRASRLLTQLDQFDDWFEMFDTNDHKDEPIDIEKLIQPGNYYGIFGRLENGEVFRPGRNLSEKLNSILLQKEKLALEVFKFIGRRILRWWD